MRRRPGPEPRVLMSRDDQFTAFVRTHRPALLRSAVNIASGDNHLAEDLLQAALIKLYLAWPRLHPTYLPSYVRRSVVNGLIDHLRRSSTRHEEPADVLPEVVDRSVEITDPDERLRAGLAAVPAGMRLAVILRHVEGLSVEETADLLGRSVGTVKSQTARGLERLRNELARLDDGSGAEPVGSADDTGNSVHPNTARRTGTSEPEDRRCAT